MNKVYRPFAISASSLGHPKRLITPITVLNLAPDDSMAAATVNALWDTGADTCVMSRRLADVLGFDFKQSVIATSILGAGKSDVGIAYVALLSNGEVVDTIAAIVDDLPSDEYSFIIGMDFIRKGSLAISSTSISTTLSFTIPSQDPIDFTKLSLFADQDRITTKLCHGKETMKSFFGKDALALIVPDSID